MGCPAKREDAVGAVVFLMSLAEQGNIDKVLLVGHLGIVSLGSFWEAHLDTALLALLIILKILSFLNKISLFLNLHV